MEKGNKNKKSLEELQDKTSGEEGIRWFMTVWRQRRKECDKKEAYLKKEGKLNEVIIPYTSLTPRDHDDGSVGDGCSNVVIPNDVLLFEDII
jgi:hypothetical protein